RPSQAMPLRIASTASGVERSRSVSSMRSFLLRIEDTDRERSTPEAVDAILKGMAWLGLEWDGQTVYQFARAARHREIANQLLAEGRAYRCYATAQDLEEMRARQREQKLPQRYDGRWRDRDTSE